MALPQDETTTEQPSIDYEALGLEPVSDEELFGFGLQTEAPEAPKAEAPEIDYETLGLEPVSDKELFGFEMPKEEVQPSESFLRPVADPFLNIGAGINDVVKGFSDAFGADNAVSQNLAKNSEWYRSLLSAGAKQDQEEIGRIMQEAEGQGVLAEIGAGLKALSVAPVDLVSQGIGSLIPFIATAGVGKAVGLGKTGVAILQGVQGGAVGGGIVKGEIYNAVKDQLINSGLDEAKAEKAAQEAQSYNGKNLDQILLGVGLGVAASTTGADSAIRSLISRYVGKEAAEQVSEQAIQEVLRTGFVRGAAKSAAVEFATEGLQGGQEKLAANIAVGREGFDVEPMRGVVTQATLEGSIGALLAGGVGGVNAKVEQMDARQKVALRDAQKAAEEAKQSNAPASAAAVEEQVNQTIEETPDQRLARLRQEEKEAAGDIELEEEVPVSGLPPAPVTPTPEAPPVAPVAPVEPVVPEVVVEPPEDVGIAPPPPRQEFTDLINEDETSDDAYQRYQSQIDEIEDRLEAEGVDIVKLVDPTMAGAQNLIGQEGYTEMPPDLVEAYARREAVGAGQLAQSVGELTEVLKNQNISEQDIKRVLDTYAIDVGKVDAFAQYKANEYTRAKVESAPITQLERVAIALAAERGEMFDAVEDISKETLLDAGRAVKAIQDYFGVRPTEQQRNEFSRVSGVEFAALPPAPEAAPVTPTPTEVAPEPPALAPLRRVVKAEQTEDDVSGLVGQGLVELYKGQPVITQAGLETLPEAERPRLTPEARKIQIDTRTSEAAAEAISKNLRIGVDQVPADVRMPSGWTLVGDVYVPPRPMPKIAGFDILPDFEVEQTADVFQSLYGKRPPVDTDKILADARAKRTGKPEELSNRPLRPRDYLNITVREALRKAATFNFLKGTRSEKFADIAAILAESPIPALSDEEIVSLGSKGRRGREARWIGGDIGMASTKGMSIETFIHEVGHTLTSDQIAKYEPSRRRGQPINGKAYIDGLRAATQDNKVPEPVRRIFSLYLSTLDQFGVMDAYSAKRGLAGTPHPDTSQRRAQKMQKEGKLRSDLTWNDLYALANVHEFVAQTFSSKSFQDKLKNLKSPINTNKTLWQEFISAIRQIFGFPSDSMAAAVVEASVDIAMVVPANRMAAFIDNQNYLESFEDARELKRYLEANNTNDLGDAKDDFRKRFNREPNAMAGQHAKYFPMLDIEAEIVKYQERVDRYRQAMPSQQAMPSPIDIDQYSPKNEEEQAAFDKASSNKVLARNPELAVAAVRLKNGEITAGEYADLVDAIDPFVAKGADPIPTEEKIKEYIASDKAPMVGVEIENGREVEFRIDIPTYNRSTAQGDPVYAITAHEPVAENAKRVGAPISYIGVAKVVNPTFMTRAISGKGSAIEIAMGAGKFPLATVKGNYEAITDLPTDINNPEVWTEVGYNPIRSNFFVDTRSGDAVVGGSEAIMVGSRVFVKNAQMEARPEGRTMGMEYAPEPEPETRFTEASPEAQTLSTMKATMEKVDSASEAKGGKPETQKVSEIAANWMESGGDTRALQDAITEFTNLSPANAQKVANAIARQYDIQQSIATAFLETPAGISVEAIPEGATLPKEVDPDRPKPVMQRLFEVFMGVRVPPVKITGNEKTLLKQQIRLKAAANRAAKGEQQKIADAVVETIKEMELRGPVRPKQVAALAKRAAKVIWTSEKSVEVFTEYAAKVVENTNYDADVREAKTAQKRAKELSKQKKVAMSPQREILSQIGNVAINKLEDPRLFAETINYYLRGFKDVRSPEYVVVPDDEMTSYLSKLETEAGRDQIEVERESNERLARKYDLDPDTIPELMGLINIIEEIEGRENREALENILTDKAIETQEGLRGYDTTPLTNEQKRLVDAMNKVDLKSINTQERQMFIRIANNMIYNNQTNGAEYFVATARGQQNAREAARDAKLIQRNKAWIPLIPSFGSLRLEETLRNFSLELQSIADTFRNVFGKDFMAKAYEKMGMLNLNEGFTKANNTIDEIQDLAAEFHQGNEKKFGDAASDQDGILSEGVAGFLIQSFPFKDEAVSIEQRRNLINEYITNARNSRQKPRVAMADRVEAILNKVDGNSVQEILNNLKREYPANHEVLMWYKDVLFPKYKGFLKQFDENFNDQANNYDSPNYLPISFTSAGPALAIGPEEASIANSISLQPKQSVYTIKRQDYTTLPKDRDGKPKEIEFNLRRASFNSLSDQINKAYTSAAWQQLFAFMKTPESVDFFGDEANRDFFVDRLNRLRASRARRGSVSGGALEKALDAFSIISRKLGTGIALGGAYQWIKQPPDQLITAWGSGGRGELLAKNLAPSNQKAARDLLNLFSIGRRGDSSAGYKYINQMEGHQSRMERYFTEKRFDKAKEQAGKIADVWMIALKKSDFVAASAAWMTYYEGELNKKEIYIDDWAKEAELAKTDPVRREAAAYAEQMTDIYQGSSDPTSMATFAQSGKTGWENFVKALLVPFNSFAIQQRMRLYSDARDAILGNKSGAGGLAGTIGGLILFHATKRYVIPAASGVGISVLYGLMGVDMEEPDEEKQKEMADRNWRQFLADMTGNLLVGGTPQIVESQVIQSFNRASYLVAMQLESETVTDENGEIMSFDKYSKERSPFYRYQSYDNAMSLGMFDIGLDQAKEVALQTKMLTDRDEMDMYTPEEQRLLYFSALSEWLLLMRLNDTDFARLVKKARRDMIKAAEDREKEIRAIRSGR